VRTARIGTRGSDLARWQTNYVAGRLRQADPSLSIEIVEIRTAGDELPEVPLEHLEGVGFFTSALERALLAREIDVAVHSYKDLPVDSSPDLEVASVPERAPVEDALCARDGLTLDRLPAGARVGTSSARRSAQLRALRPDLVLEPLRGNVPTRLGRVTRGDLDAVVLARAGLSRLGLAGHITEVFPLERVLPAPAQGALAVQSRKGDPELAARLRAIDDAPSRLAVEAERALLHALGGGCSVPVGAHATASGGLVTLEAGVFDPADGRAIHARIEAGNPTEAGERAARRLLEQGAGRILAAFAKTPRLVVEGE
jgi:hydroxymethylbilane synthase